MEYPVFRNSGRVRHNRYPLLQAEVIPKDLGTEPSPLVIGASEQFLEQVMPEAGLSFYDALEPRQFEGKHGRAVLQGDSFFLAGCAARIKEREHGEWLPSVAGHRCESVSEPDGRRMLAGELRQLLLPVAGLIAMTRRPRTSRGQQVALWILDDDREAGELIHNFGNSPHSPPFHRRLGEPAVNGKAALKSNIDDPKLLRCRMLACVDIRIGDGDPDLLSEDPEEEVLSVLDRHLSSDDNVSEGTLETAHWKSPRPALALDLDGPTQSVEVSELPLNGCSDRTPKARASRF